MPTYHKTARLCLTAWWLHAVYIWVFSKRIFLHIARAKRNALAHVCTRLFAPTLPWCRASVPGESLLASALWPFSYIPARCGIVLTTWSHTHSHRCLGFCTQHGLCHRARRHPSARVLSKPSHTQCTLGVKNHLSGQAKETAPCRLAFVTLLGLHLWGLCMGCAGDLRDL